VRKAILAVSALVLACSVASGQISLVNVTQCGPGAFPANVCTIPATGSGHLIVVGFVSVVWTTPTISGISDNANNVYAEAGPARGTDVASNETEMVDLWYAKNSTAGATTITITPSPTGNWGAAVIWEFSGVDTASPLDQTSVLNSQAATTAPSGASVTTTAPAEAVISLIAVGYWVTQLQSGSNFTSDAVINADPAAGSIALGAAHLITTGAGTYAPSWVTAPDPFTSSTVSFKAAGAISPCDLNASNAVDVVDVQLATNTYLDAPGAMACPPGLLCNAIYVQNITTTALGQPCSLTMLGATQSPLNFGNVAVGNTGTQSATFTLTGSGATTIAQVAASPSTYTVSGPTLPLTLSAGNSATFNVAFKPTATGTVSGNIAVTTSSSGSALNSPFNLPVTGAGVTSGGSHNVTLSWTASTSSNVASYNIYRITSSSTTAPTTPYPVLVSGLAASGTGAVCSGTACSYVDTSVTAGTSYWYYAAAVDSSNNVSGPSNTAQGVVPSP